MRENTMPRISCSADNGTHDHNRRRRGPSIFRRDGEKAMSKERVTSLMYSILIVLAAMVLPAMLADQASAQGVCSEPGNDSDADGFNDTQECSTGVTTAGIAPLTFPPCVGGEARDICVDANSKDLFVIYKPATTGSLLLANNLQNPFNNVTVLGNNIAATFTGLSALGITVHQITEANAATDRTISGTQKAIKITESLDANGTILGNCQWGTPQSLDGCVVFTQRILNFINSVCDSVNDRTTDRLSVFRAY